MTRPSHSGNQEAVRDCKQQSEPGKRRIGFRLTESGPTFGLLNGMFIFHVIVATKQHRQLAAT